MNNSGNGTAETKQEFKTVVFTVTCGMAAALGLFCGIFAEKVKKKTFNEG